MLKGYAAIARNVALILAGNIIYALAVTMFIIPNGLITGGTTGLALLFFHQLGIDISIFVAFFNVAMFILGAVVLGRTFAFTTLISTFFYPFILNILQKVTLLRDITSDRLLSAVFAGIMIGFSIGVIINAGASTGGMDIPPLVLNKKLGLSVSMTLYVLDFIILLSQMFFASKEQVLYGILLVVIYTVVLNQVLLLGHSRTQVKIISEKYQEINEMINKHLDRGSTLFYGETGYLHSKNMIVLTVVSNRELPRLNQLVLSLDPKAFMIINRVNEVRGRGFTLEKIYKEL